MTCLSLPVKQVFATMNLKPGRYYLCLNSSRPPIVARAKADGLLHTQACVYSRNDFQELYEIEVKV